MKRYFSRHLGQALSDKIVELAESPFPDQVELFEELAVARVMAVEALKLAEPVLNGASDVKESTRALAFECLRDTMNHVKDMVTAVSKVDALSRGKVSLQTVNLIVLQVVKIIHDECEGDEDLGKRIEKKIMAEVRLPADENDVKVRIADGISSTPDMIASEMDESVCGEDD